MAGPVSVAVMPTTHWSAKLLADAANNDTDWRRLYAAKGIIVFSSKYPPAPASATAASLPTTCAATWMTDSDITGLTLPGMMLLPGCTSGTLISPSPARGPQPRKRISLAILCRLMATVFNWPLASTMPSRADCAWK